MHENFLGMKVKIKDLNISSGGANNYTIMVQNLWGAISVKMLILSTYMFKCIELYTQVYRLNIHAQV